MAISPKFSVEERLAVCKSTREIAANSLFDALTCLLEKDEPISEVGFRDQWLYELRKNKSIFGEGWYSPPPYGIGALFGTDEPSKKNRVNFQSLRTEENWQRKDIFLDRKKGLAFVYASPVDKKTGIIGDFGLTIYFGKKLEIIKHLQTCYSLTNEIFERIEIGMTFGELTEVSSQLIRHKGLTSEVECKTVACEENLGHVVPASYKSWNQQEQKIINSQELKKVKEIISKKREFIGIGEEFKIRPGLALTIEPRPRDIGKPKIPLVAL